MGKTTTAINLSAALAVMEKKVLLVDCDPQANSTSGIGLHQEDLHGDLYNTFYEPEKLKENIAKSRSPFLDILPASTNLVAVELELVDKMAREFFLDECLKSVRNDYYPRLPSFSRAFDAQCPLRVTRTAHSPAMRIFCT